VGREALAGAITEPAWKPSELYLVVTDDRDDHAQLSVSCPSGRLDGARVAWQSRDLCVASLLPLLRSSTGREGARNDFTLDDNAIPTE